VLLFASRHFPKTTEKSGRPLRNSPLDTVPPSPLSTGKHFLPSGQPAPIFPTMRARTGLHSLPARSTRSSLLTPNTFTPRALKATLPSSVPFLHPPLTHHLRTPRHHQIALRPKIKLHLPNEKSIS